MRVFEDIAKEIMALHKRKNMDYGNAFGKSYATYEAFGKGEGLKYAIGRMGDKMTRLQNAAYSKKDLNYESIEDTLMDMASYAIMTLVELNNNE